MINLYAVCVRFDRMRKFLSISFLHICTNQTFSPLYHIIYASACAQPFTSLISILQSHVAACPPSCSVALLHLRSNSNIQPLQSSVFCFCWFAPLPICNCSLFLFLFFVLQCCNNLPSLASIAYLSELCSSHSSACLPHLLPATFCRPSVFLCLCLGLLYHFPLPIPLVLHLQLCCLLLPSALFSSFFQQLLSILACSFCLRSFDFPFPFCNSLPSLSVFCSLSCNSSLPSSLHSVSICHLFAQVGRSQTLIVSRFEFVNFYASIIRKSFVSFHNYRLFFF